MDNKYTDEQGLTIAKNCNHFEHVINAMSYGYPLLNVLPNNYERCCTECTNCLSGSCKIFEKKYLNNNIPE